LTGSARVLVIEDDERVRALTVRMLRKHGYSTIEASTTREGRDVFDIEDGNVDIVVSDVVMPDGRGPELAAQLCARDPNVRFLLMTGYDDDSLDQKLLSKIPHYELLRKPFVEGALLRSVRDLLSRPKVDVDAIENSETHRQNVKPRILLVDDDAGTRRTYQRLLDEEFDLVVLDDSLDDVMEVLRRENFDMIFFDVMMPRVSGFDLAERVRGVSPENAERIVHLTGMQDDTMVNAYAKQTKQHIMSKPLTLEKLRELLSQENRQRAASA
ncbi:MAG: response regulator, partial [Myxococcota bacterium]